MSRNIYNVFLVEPVVQLVHFRAVSYPRVFCLWLYLRDGAFERHSGNGHLFSLFSSRSSSPPFSSTIALPASNKRSPSSTDLCRRSLIVVYNVRLGGNRGLFFSPFSGLAIHQRSQITRCRTELCAGFRSAIFYASCRLGN